MPPGSEQMPDLDLGCRHFNHASVSEQSHFCNATLQRPPSVPSVLLIRLLLAHSSEFFARSFLSEFRESVDRRIVLHFRDPLNVFPEVRCLLLKRRRRI